MTNVITDEEAQSSVAQLIGVPAQVLLLQILSGSHFSSHDAPWSEQKIGNELNTRWTNVNYYNFFHTSAYISKPLLEKRATLARPFWKNESMYTSGIVYRSQLRGCLLKLVTCIEACLCLSRKL